MIENFFLKFMEMAPKIEKKSASAWWVPQTMRRKVRVLALVKCRCLKRNCKFRIRISRTIKEALEEDKRNGNTLWRDAIKKEMDEVKVAFHIVESGEEIPSNYSFMKCHMTFDVKIENFHRKE